MIAVVNTSLRYYLKLDPSTLSDEEWAEQFYMLEQLREDEKNRSLNQMGQYFGKS